MWINPTFLQLLSTSSCDRRLLKRRSARGISLSCWAGTKLEGTEAGRDPDRKKRTTDSCAELCSAAVSGCGLSATLRCVCCLCPRGVGGRHRRVLPRYAPEMSRSVWGDFKFFIFLLCCTFNLLVQMKATWVIYSHSCAVVPNQNLLMTWQWDLSSDKLVLSKDCQSQEWNNNDDNDENWSWRDNPVFFF